MQYTLTEKEKGVLEELVNISFGLSASLVEQLLETPVHLHIPKIEVIDLNDMSAFLEAHDSGKLPLYISKQLFRGKVAGEIVFTLPSQSAIEFAKILYKEESELTRNYVEGSLLELTNIMTSSCVGQLTEMLGVEAHFVEPYISLSDTKNFITSNDLTTYTKIIAMKTLLDLEEISISGDMFILTNPESFSTLKELIGKF